MSEEEKKINEDIQNEEEQEIQNSEEQSIIEDASDTSESSASETKEEVDGTQSEKLPFGELPCADAYDDPWVSWAMTKGRELEDGLNHLFSEIKDLRKLVVQKKTQKRRFFFLPSSKKYCQKMSLDEYWAIAKKQRYSISKTVVELYLTGKFGGDPLPSFSTGCDEILGMSPSDLARFLREGSLNKKFLSALTCVFDAPPSFWKSIWKNRPAYETAYFLPHFNFDPIIITDMLLNLSVGKDVFNVQSALEWDRRHPILNKHFSLLVESGLIKTQEVDIPAVDRCFGPVGYYRVSGPTILVLGLTSRGESVAQVLSLPGGLDRVVSASCGKPFEYFVEYAEHISRKNTGRGISRIGRFLSRLRKFGFKKTQHEEGDGTFQKP